MRRFLIGMIRATALLASGAFALLVAFWAWKREVTFARDHWRFGHHVSGTDLAAFPLIAPVSAPLYSQKIGSSFMPWVSLSYTSSASFAEVMRGIGAACPNERWVRMTEAELRQTAATHVAFSCRRVLFDVTSRPDGEAVYAFLAD